MDAEQQHAAVLLPLLGGQPALAQRLETAALLEVDLAGAQRHRPRVSVAAPEVLRVDVLVLHGHVVPWPRVVHEHAATHAVGGQHLGEQHRQVSLAAAEVHNRHTPRLCGDIVTHRRNHGRRLDYLFDETLGPQQPPPESLVAAVAAAPPADAGDCVCIHIGVHVGAGSLGELSLEPRQEGELAGSGHRHRGEQARGCGTSGRPHIQTLPMYARAASRPVGSRNHRRLSPRLTRLQYYGGVCR